MPFSFRFLDSSPDEALAEVVAAFLARREVRPAGPLVAVRRWFMAGDAGREVSGVGIGVASVEVTLLLEGFGCAVICELKVSL